MANRYFEDKKHLELYQKFRISPPPELIQKILNFLREKFDGELNLAVDVGCGSGQNTVHFSKYFKNVLATDISPNQIAQAKQHNKCNNLTFELSPAEKIQVEDGSVQLITAAAAAHWFDLPAFFQEGSRVLCQHGVMALYGYFISHLHLETDPSKNEEINAVYAECISSGLKDFWPSQVKQHVFTNYKDIVLPFSDFTRDEHTFFNQRRVSLSDVVGEIQTFSGFQRMRESNGEEAAEKFISEIRERIRTVTGESQDDEIFFTETTPYILLIARKA